MAHVWVPDDEMVYIPAEVLKTKGNNYALRTSAGGYLEVAKAKCIDILDPLVLTELCDDLVRLLEVNKPTILHTLRERFVKNLIYTSIGTILIAVNPFRYFPELYSVNSLRSYRDPFIESLSPHIFHIASKAFYSLMNFKVNQSMIISGESGSGKTEATKHCLKFFADVSTGATKGVENKILSSSPILEAFGNAKTVRNDNSSRFGKWMDIGFNDDAAMMGCGITSYLLEKSRVVMQDDGERNFHIMYQLLLGYSTICQLANSEGDTGNLRLRSEGKQEIIDEDDDDATRKRQAAELRRKRIAAHPVPIELCRALERANFPIGDRMGKLISPDSFRYTCVSTQPLDDVEGLLDTLCGMDVMGFSFEYIVQVLSVVCGVLYLGNVRFDATQGGEGSDISRDSEAILLAASMFRVDSQALTSALCFRTISVPSQKGTKRMSFTKVPLRVAVAEDSRDALSKKMYENLFFDLVDNINRTIKSPSGVSLCIGLLDIFGFEIFKTNSFEQLCINFANENLQQHFNYHIFTLETELYKQEHVECHQVSFQNNQDVLDLVVTLFKDLDEEGKLPKASSLSFFGKFKRKYSSFLGSSNNDRVQFPPGGDKLRIRHYAGLVDYSPALFMEKNLDAFYDDLRQTIQQSADPFIASLVQRNYGDSSSSTGSNARQTIAKTFRSQLTSLVETLNSTSPHFVRCIKSNNLKQSMLFDSPKVEEQLRYSGVFEAVEIQQSGLPFRHKHEAFVVRYHCVVLHRNNRARTLNCSQLIELIKQDFPGVRNCQIGRTMVFYTSTEHRILEKARRDVETRSAVRFQKSVRRFVMQNLHRQLMKAKSDVKKAKAECDLSLANSCVAKIEVLQQRYLNFCLCIFSNTIIEDAMTSRAEIQERVEILNGLETIANPFRASQSKSEISMEDLEDEASYDNLKELMDRASSVGLSDHKVVTELRNRYDSLCHAVESKKLLQKAMGSASRLDIETSVNRLQDLVDRKVIPLEYCDRLLILARDRISVIVDEHDTVLPKLTLFLESGCVEVDSKTDELLIENLSWLDLEEYVDKVSGRRKLSTVECTEMLQSAYFIAKLRKSIGEKNFVQARKYLDMVALTRSESFVEAANSSKDLKLQSMLSISSLVDEIVDDDSDVVEFENDDDLLESSELMIKEIETEISNAEADDALNSLTLKKYESEIRKLNGDDETYKTECLMDVHEEEKDALDSNNDELALASFLSDGEIELGSDNPDVDFSSDEEKSSVKELKMRRDMRRSSKSHREARKTERSTRKSSRDDQKTLLLEKMSQLIAVSKILKSNISDLQTQLREKSNELSGVRLEKDRQKEKLSRDFNLALPVLIEKNHQKLYILPICHPEIRTMSLYVSAYSQLLKLCNFVANGRIPHNVPYLKTRDSDNMIEYGQLEEFLSEVESGSDFPASMHIWLEWARTVVQVRKYVDMSDWSSLQVVVESFEETFEGYIDEMNTIPADCSLTITVPLSRNKFLAIVKDEGDRASRHLLHARYLASLKEICTIELLQDVSVDNEHLMDGNALDTLDHHIQIVDSAVELDFDEDPEFCSVKTAATIITNLRSACNSSDISNIEDLLSKFDAAGEVVKMLIGEEIRSATRIYKCLKSIAALKSALSLHAVKYNHNLSQLDISDTKTEFLKSSLEYSDVATDWSKSVAWLSIAAAAIQDLRTEILKPVWSLTRVKALSRRLTLSGTICSEALLSSPGVSTVAHSKPTLSKSSSYLCPVCPNECIKELVDIRFEVELKEIGDLVSSVLKQVKVSGSVGSIVLSSTPQEKILSEIEIRLCEAVNKYGVHSSRCFSLVPNGSPLSAVTISPNSIVRLEACKFLVSIRSAVKDGNWDHIKCIVELFDSAYDGRDSVTRDVEFYAENNLKDEEMKTKSVSSSITWKPRIKEGFSLPIEATNELKLLSLEVKHIALIKQLRRAVTNGCVVGSVGNLKFTEFNVEDLNAALKNADLIGCHNSECQSLHNIAASLLSMRIQLRSSMFRSARVLDVDELNRTMALQKSLGLRISEIELFLNHKLNLHVIDNFLLGLSNAGSLDAIDSALIEYDQLVTSASDVQSLSHLCRAIKRLRKAFQSEIREEISPLSTIVLRLMSNTPLFQFDVVNAESQFFECFVPEVISPFAAHRNLGIEVQHVVTVVQAYSLIDMLQSGLQLGSISHLDSKFESLSSDCRQNYLGVVDELLVRAIHDSYRVISETVARLKSWRSTSEIIAFHPAPSSPLELWLLVSKDITEFIDFISNGAICSVEESKDGNSVSAAYKKMRSLGDDLASLFRDGCVSCELRANLRVSEELLWQNYQDIIMRLWEIGILRDIKNPIVLEELSTVLTEISLRKLLSNVTSHNCTFIVRSIVISSPDGSICFTAVDDSCVQFVSAVSLIKICSHTVSSISTLSDFLSVLKEDSVGSNLDDYNNSDLALFMLRSRNFSGSGTFLRLCELLRLFKFMTCVRRLTCSLWDQSDNSCRFLESSIDELLGILENPSKDPRLPSLDSMIHSDVAKYFKHCHQQQSYSQSRSELNLIESCIYFWVGLNELYRELSKQSLSNEVDYFHLCHGVSCYAHDLIVSENKNDIQCIAHDLYFTIVSIRKSLAMEDTKSAEKKLSALIFPQSFPKPCPAVDLFQKILSLLQNEHAIASGIAINMLTMEGKKLSSNTYVPVVERLTPVSLSQIADLANSAESCLLESMDKLEKMLYLSANPSSSLTGIVTISDILRQWCLTTTLIRQICQSHDVIKQVPSETKNVISSECPVISEATLNALSSIFLHSAEEKIETLQKLDGIQLSNRVRAAHKDVECRICICKILLLVLKFVAVICSDDTTNKKESDDKLLSSFVLPPANHDTLIVAKRLFQSGSSESSPSHCQALLKSLGVVLNLQELLFSCFSTKIDTVLESESLSTLYKNCMSEKSDQKDLLTAVELLCLLEETLGKCVTYSKSFSVQVSSRSEDVSETCDVLSMNSFFSSLYGNIWEEISDRLVVWLRQLNLSSCVKKLELSMSCSDFNAFSAAFNFPNDFFCSSKCGIVFSGNSIDGSREKPKIAQLSECIIAASASVSKWANAVESTPSQTSDAFSFSPLDYPSSQTETVSKSRNKSRVSRTLSIKPIDGQEFKSPRLSYTLNSPQIRGIEESSALGTPGKVARAASESRAMRRNDSLFLKLVCSVKTRIAQAEFLLTLRHCIVGNIWNNSDCDAHESKCVDDCVHNWRKTISFSSVLSANESTLPTVGINLIQNELILAEMLVNLRNAVRCLLFTLGICGFCGNLGHISRCFEKKNCLDTLLHEWSFLSKYCVTTEDDCLYASALQVNFVKKALIHRFQQFQSENHDIPTINAIERLLSVCNLCLRIRRYASECRWAEILDFVFSLAPNNGASCSSLLSDEIGLLFWNSCYMVLGDRLQGSLLASNQKVVCWWNDRKKHPKDADTSNCAGYGDVSYFRQDADKLVNDCLRASAILKQHCCLCLCETAESVAETIPLAVQDFLKSIDYLLNVRDSVRSACLNGFRDNCDDSIRCLRNNLEDCNTMFIVEKKHLNWSEATNLGPSDVFGDKIGRHNGFSNFVQQISLNHANLSCLSLRSISHPCLALWNFWDEIRSYCHLYTEMTCSASLNIAMDNYSHFGIRLEQSDKFSKVQLASLVRILQSLNSNDVLTDDCWCNFLSAFFIVLCHSMGSFLEAKTGNISSEYVWKLLGKFNFIYRLFSTTNITKYTTKIIESLRSSMCSLYRMLYACNVWNRQEKLQSLVVSSLIDWKDLEYLIGGGMDNLCQEQNRQDFLIDIPEDYSKLSFYVSCCCQFLCMSRKHVSALVGSCLGRDVIVGSSVSLSVDLAVDCGILMMISPDAEALKLSLSSTFNFLKQWSEIFEVHFQQDGFWMNLSDIFHESMRKITEYMHFLVIISDLIAICSCLFLFDSVEETIFEPVERLRKEILMISEGHAKSMLIIAYLLDKVKILLSLRACVSNNEWLANSKKQTNSVEQILETWNTEIINRNLLILLSSSVVDFFSVPSFSSVDYCLNAGVSEVTSAKQELICLKMRDTLTFGLNRLTEADFEATSAEIENVLALIKWSHIPSNLYSTVSIISESNLTKAHYPGLVQSVWKLGVPQSFCDLLYVCHMLVLLRKIEEKRWWSALKSVSLDNAAICLQSPDFLIAGRLIAQFQRNFKISNDCKYLRRELTRPESSESVIVTPEATSYCQLVQLFSNLRHYIALHDFPRSSMACIAISEYVATNNKDFASVAQFDETLCNLITSELDKCICKLDTEFLLSCLTNVDDSAINILKLLPVSRQGLSVFTSKIPAEIIDKCRRWIKKSDTLSLFSASFEMMRKLSNFSTIVFTAKAGLSQSSYLKIPPNVEDLDFEYGDTSFDDLLRYDFSSVMQRELKFLLSNAARFFLSASSPRSQTLVNSLVNFIAIDQLHHEISLSLSEFNDHSPSADGFVAGDRVGDILLKFCQSLARVTALLNQSSRESHLFMNESTLVKDLEIAKLIRKRRIFVLRSFQNPVESTLDDLSSYTSKEMDQGAEETKKIRATDNHDILSHYSSFLGQVDQESKMGSIVLFNKTIADKLKACIRNGQCWFDSNGNIVGTETLESTRLLEMALHVVNNSPGTRSNEDVKGVIAISEFLLLLRKSVLNGNWGGIPPSYYDGISKFSDIRISVSQFSENSVPCILQQLSVYLSSSNTLHEPVRQEICRILDQMENIHAKNVLNLGIQDGSLSSATKSFGGGKISVALGTGMENANSALSVNYLLASLDWCKNRVGNKFESTKVLFDAANIISQLRGFLIENDWDSMKSYLQSEKRILGTQLSCLENISKIAHNEILLFSMIDDADSRLSRELSDALSQNRIRGTAAALDTSDTSATLLNSIIVRSCECGFKSQNTRVLLNSAIIVRDLRLGLIASDHARVNKLLVEKCSRSSSSRLNQSSSTKSNDISEIALDEILLVQRSIDYLVWLNEVRNIVATGGPTGQVGKLDTSSIDLFRTLSALSLIKSVGTSDTISKSGEQEKAISSLTFLFKIRTAVKHNEWGADELSKFSTPDVITPLLTLRKAADSGDDNEFVGHIKFLAHPNTQRAVYRSYIKRDLRAESSMARDIDDNLMQLVLNLKMMGQTPPYHNRSIDIDSAPSSTVDADIHTHLLQGVGDGWSNYYQHRDFGDNEFFLLSSLLSQWKGNVSSPPSSSAVSYSVPTSVAFHLAELCRESSSFINWQLSEDCVEEIQLIRNELYHKILMTKFSDALSNCPSIIRSRYGNDSEKIVTSKSGNFSSVKCLDEAIAMALHLGTPSIETRKLLISARLLRCVRFHVERRDWVAICQCGNGGLSLMRIAKRFFDLNLLDGQIHQELTRTFDEIHKISICDQLIFSVSRSCVQNCVSIGPDQDDNSSNTNSLLVDTDGLLDLRKTVTSISRIGCPPDEIGNDVTDFTEVHKAMDDSAHGGVMRLICALGEFLFRLRMAIKTGNYLAASDLSLSLFPRKTSMIQPLLDLLNKETSSSFSRAEENIDWLMIRNVAEDRPLFSSMESIISTIDKLELLVVPKCAPISLDECSQELKSLMSKKLLRSTDLMPLVSHALLTLAKSEASVLLTVVLNMETVKAGKFVMEFMPSRMERVVEINKSTEQHLDSLENCFNRFSTAVQAVVQAIGQCGAQESESNKAFLQSIQSRQLVVPQVTVPEITKPQAQPHAPARRMSTASLLSVAPPPSIQQSVTMEKASVYSGAVQQGVDNQPGSKSHAAHFPGHKSGKQMHGKPTASIQRRQSLQSQKQLPPAQLSLLCPDAGGVYCGIPVVYLSESFLSIVRRTLDFIGPNVSVSASSLSACRVHLIASLSSMLMAVAQFVQIPQTGQIQQPLQTAPGLAARVIEISASESQDNDQNPCVITASISKSVTSGPIVMVPLRLFQPLAKLLGKFDGKKLTYFQESFLPPDGWLLLGEVIEVSVCFLVRCGRVHELIASLDLVNEALNCSVLVKAIKKSASYIASKQIRVIKTFRGEDFKERDENPGKYLSDTIFEEVEDESADVCPDSPLMSTISRSTNVSFGFGVPVTPKESTTPRKLRIKS